MVFLVLFLLRVRELDKFAAITSNCRAQIAEARNGVAGEIISAFSISREKISEIEREASAYFGKRLRLSLRLDPSVIGGVMVKAGDLVLDGTVDHQLDSVRRSLLA